MRPQCVTPVGIPPHDPPTAPYARHMRAFFLRDPMPPETLREKQSRFVRMVVQLIEWGHAQGYQFTFGDAYRDPRVFGQVGESRGYGSSTSCHKSRLAIDLNLFRDGEMLEGTEDHRPLGEYWESLGGTWGGRFQDGNHYSLAHNGRK